MTIETMLSPRHALRAHYRDALGAATQKVHGGPWDGREVVPVEDIEQVLGAPLPPTSDHGAELRTAGIVTVSAECPQCSQVALIALRVATELRVEDDGSTLRLKGKSKAASHTCGQTTLDGVPGQDSFELEDIVGDSDEEEPEA